MNRTTNQWPAKEAVTFEKIAFEWMKWSVKTFELATSISSLSKAKSELYELTDALIGGAGRSEIAKEYVDVMMCLLHSAAKEGLTIDEMIQAFKEKAVVNYGRTWSLDPSGNTYSHLK